MSDPRFFRKYLDILSEDEVPAVKNIVVPPDTTAPAMLRGRVPVSPDQVTHAYRNMSPAELDSAKQSGYFTKNPNPGKTTWDTNQKFWSQGDAEGSFGRSWKAGKDAVTVRVPVGNVPAETAVSAGHVELKHPVTGEWTKMRPAAAPGGASTAGSASTGGGAGFGGSGPLSGSASTGRMATSGGRSGGSGPLSGGGAVQTGTGNLLRQMNPQKLS